jgi:hypothetical protein
MVQPDSARAGTLGAEALWHGDGQRTLVIEVDRGLTPLSKSMPKSRLHTACGMWKGSPTWNWQLHAERLRL